MLSDRLKHRSISRDACIGPWGHGPRYGCQTRPLAALAACSPALPLRLKPRHVTWAITRKNKPRRGENPSAVHSRESHLSGMAVSYRSVCSKTSAILSTSAAYFF